MKTQAYTYWRDGRHWLGYLDEFPDYMTQGATRRTLENNLVDIYRDLTSGEIPAIRRRAALQVA